MANHTLRIRHGLALFLAGILLGLNMRRRARQHTASPRYWNAPSDLAEEARRNAEALRWEQEHRTHAR